MKPEEIQQEAQFRQLIGAFEQVNEMLVTGSSQLSAIANQLLQVRQHLQQVKALLPPPVAPPYPTKGKGNG